LMPSRPHLRGGLSPVPVAVGAGGGLPFLPLRIGDRWRTNEEVDVVAVEQEAAMLVGCKWANRPVEVDVLRNLERKAGLVEEELGPRRLFFGLCACSGFTPQVEDEGTRREDILLFGLSRVVICQSKTGSFVGRKQGYLASSSQRRWGSSSVFAGQRTLPTLRRSRNCIEGRIGSCPSIYTGYRIFRSLQCLLPCSATHWSLTDRSRFVTPHPSDRTPTEGIHDNSGSVGGSSTC